MKKMFYISPQIVTMLIKVRPLLTGSSFVEGETIDGGGINDIPVYDWDDDEEGL